MSKVEVTGLDEVIAMVAKIEDRIAKKKIFVTAMRKAMLPLQEEIQRTAPDDPDTVGSRISLYTRRAVLNQSSVGVLGKTGVAIQGFVGYFHEFGTDEGLAAHPFAEPSEQRTRTEFMSILGEELWLGIIGHSVEEALDG